jgi:hypothetical protein
MLIIILIIIIQEKSVAVIDRNTGKLPFEGDFFNEYASLIDPVLVIALGMIPPK